MLDEGRSLVVLTPEQLRALVVAAVREALEGRAAEPAEPAEWLDTAGAAELLGVTTRTIRKLASAGKLTASKVGPKLLRFRRADVLAYLSRDGA